MSESRILRITILVEDEGGPDDYDRIFRTLSSIGAEVESEEVVLDDD